MSETLKTLSHPTYFPATETSQDSLRELEKQGLGLLHGINSFYIRLLIEKSREPLMLKHVPHDSEKRFANPESYLEWQRPDRHMFLLRKNGGGDLAGVVWFVPHRNELLEQQEISANYTFAIRIYDGYNGKGLAKPLMEVAHQKLFDIEGNNISGVWLDTDVDNTVARNLYNEFGYQEVANDKDRVVMVLSPERFKSNS
jgi:GNAT superfamily N-acetyltransferase